MRSVSRIFMRVFLLVWIVFSLQCIPGCTSYRSLPSTEEEPLLDGGGDYISVLDGDEELADEDVLWGDFTCGMNTVLVNQGFDSPGPNGEIRISSATSIIQHDGDGNKVVYTDLSGNPYLIDLTEETEMRLDDLLFDDVGLLRSWIRDDIVIYNALFTNNVGEYGGAIVICDLQTKRGKILYGQPEEDGSGRFWASVSQRRVVWQDPRFAAIRNNLEIYMYDMDNDTETRITDAPRQQSLPDIFGDYIVWRDHRDPLSAVYLYQISTGEELKISPENSGDYGYPEIWGDSVVFVGEENTTYNPDGNVYHYSIERDELTPIAFSGSGCCLHVGEKYVAYSGWGENTGETHWHDVYIYDLETQEEKRVTWRPSNNGHGIVMGNKILWNAVGDGLFITPVDSL